MPAHEKIIQIEAMQTDLLNMGTDPGYGHQRTEIRGILWGLGEYGTLYRLNDDNQWEEVAK